MDARSVFDSSGQPLSVEVTQMLGKPPYISVMQGDIPMARGYIVDLVRTGDPLDFIAREYPPGVDPEAVDIAVSAVFAEMKGDTWRQGSLREIVGTVLHAIAPKGLPAPETPGESAERLYYVSYVYLRPSVSANAGSNMEHGAGTYLVAQPVTKSSMVALSDEISSRTEGEVYVVIIQAMIPLDQ